DRAHHLAHRRRLSPANTIGPRRHPTRAAVKVGVASEALGWSRNTSRHIPVRRRGDRARFSARSRWERLPSGREAGGFGSMSIERDRLKQNRDAWIHWGPYLSERAWGTVREDYSPGGTAWDYFPHDHARSRAFRWSEDGIAGLSDLHQRLCF